MITLNANGLDLTTMACLLLYAKQCKFPDVVGVQEAKTDLIPGMGHCPYKAILHPPNKEETNEPIGGTVVLVHKRWWGGLNELSTSPNEGDVCWAKLSSKHMTILVGSLYLWNKTGLLPTSDLDFESQMSAIRSRVEDYQNKGAHVFLMGDVNYDH
mgnify:FL=1